MPAPDRLATPAPVTAEHPMEVYIGGIDVTDDEGSSSSYQDHSRWVLDSAPAAAAKESDAGAAVTAGEDLGRPHGWKPGWTT